MSFSKSKSKTSSSQEANPWDITIPGLQTITDQIGGYLGNTGLTSEQSQAFANLKANAMSGNPLTENATATATNMANYQSRSPTVDQAYQTMQNNLSGMAAGDNLDVANNPQLQRLLTTIGDDITNRVKGTWAGSGRSISGNAGGIQALGRGMEQGLAPTMLAQYNQERQNQIAANNMLFGGANTAATTAQGLDKDALGLNLAGSTTAMQAAQEAENSPWNTLLNLAQQEKSLPWQNTGILESLLGPIAQLGGTQTGESTTKGSSSTFNVGSIIGAVAALSDERLKDNKEKVGALNDGTPIYSFTYKGDPNKKTHIGVMAQDIEEEFPDAVIAFGGVKYVDYDKATRRSAAMEKRNKDHAYA